MHVRVEAGLVNESEGFAVDLLGEEVECLDRVLGKMDDLLMGFLEFPTKGGSEKARSIHKKSLVQVVFLAVWSHKNLDHLACHESENVRKSRSKVRRENVFMHWFGSLWIRVCLILRLCVIFLFLSLAAILPASL